MGFTDLFTDMGFTSAILHKQNITKKEYASLYWFNIVFSIFLYGMLFLISPYISDFYNEPKLKMLIPLLGLNVVISAVGRIFKTMESKHLKFKEITIFEIIAACFSLIFSIFLAIDGYGVLALVYSVLLQYIIQNILYFIFGIRKYGLLRHFRLMETRPFLKIGIFQVGGQVVNYFNRDLDILIVGKFFGQEILGGYSLAKQLVYRPTQILNPIFTKVAGPILAKMQTDINLLKVNYLKFLNYIMTINLPVYLGLIIFAPYIVALLYGRDYGNIVGLVRILSVYMLFRAMGNPLGSLVIASGRTDLELYWNLLTLIVLPILIVFGAYFSIEMVALCLNLGMLLLLIPGWRFLIHKLTGATLNEYLSSLVPRLSVIKKVYSSYFK